MRKINKAQEEPGHGSCFHRDLQTWAKLTPDAVAIAASGRVPLKYGRLFEHISEVTTILNSMGIGRNDRVALVLPDGPEMSVAFLAVSACATAAPLNPGYRSNEFKFYLSDLNARVLLINQGSESPAIDVARELGVSVIELIF